MTTMTANKRFELSVDAREREELRTLLGNERITLASGSPRRREILRVAGVEFDVVVPEVDEDVPDGAEPRRYALDLALRKLEAIPANGTLTVAADTIVVLDNHILGKPVDRADAIGILNHLAGHRHYVLTALAVRDKNGRTLVDGEVSWVKFFSLDESAIAAYVDSGEPMDKAGAYGIQGMGELLVEELTGSLLNVIGFPLSLFVRMVRGLRS